MNKKGNFMLVFLLIGTFFLLIFFALFFIFGSMIVNWTMDEVVPEISNLGVIGNANLTEIAGYTVAPVNSIVQSFTWLSGVIYVLGLLGCFGLAFAFRINGNKWVLSLFVILMFLLIIVSIFVSNIYEDFYDDEGDVGDRLREHVLLSFLIRYSPMIYSVVGFICGIIMFTGDPMEEGI